MASTFSLSTEAAMEQLSDALDRAVRCGEFTDDATDPRAWIKADSRLLDACIDAGMDRDTADHRAWAAETVAEWLSSGPVTCMSCDAVTDDAAELCWSCIAEARVERSHMLEMA